MKGRKAYTLKFYTNVYICKNIRLMSGSNPYIASRYLIIGALIGVLGTLGGILLNNYLNEQKEKTTTEETIDYKQPTNGNKGKSTVANDTLPINSDSDVSNLEGIIKGRGQVGGGLSYRGVARMDTPFTRGNQTGTVSVELCIDKIGRVQSSKITQRGTTIRNEELYNIVMRSARKWRFQPNEKDKQCGIITYNFKRQ